MALSHEEHAMRPEEIGCVVGIDVAKASPVVCALEAPRGAVRLTSASIAASTAGDAQRGQWLREWGEPPTLRIGRESTGSWWGPLYDTLTQAGYRVLLRTPHQTASWARSRGLRAKTAGIDARTLARGRVSGWARASTVPNETGQATRGVTRARRDLIEPQRAGRQGAPTEGLPGFPA